MKELRPACNVVARSPKNRRMIDMERRIDKCKKAIETTKKAANLAAFLFNSNR
jgi:hypothetical protein